MEILWCYHNLLTVLDVSRNPALACLNCQENSLTTLDLRNNTALGTRDCWGEAELQLSAMPTLGEVCIWDSSFFDNVAYNIEGSLKACFETDCDGVCTSIDGIKQNQTENLCIYPNPFSTSATLEWNKTSRIERIEMLNLLGETVRVIEHVNPGNPLIIHRGSLPAGVYFMKVKADKSYVIKVLIE